MANPVDFASITRFYANHTQVNVSLFEIRLVASFVVGINPENHHLLAPESLILSMSPELAASAHRLLGKALEAYAREYGELRAAKQAKQPPSVQENYDSRASEILDKT